MTRNEVLKAFFFKSVLPIAVAVLVFSVFKPIYMEDGGPDYIMLWLLCGLPFGLSRLRTWIIPGNTATLGDSAALFALNFFFAALIGGFVLIWRLIVAVCYIPLTIYRLITV